MRREQIARARGRERGRERHPGLVHERTRALEHRERGVALVQVTDLRPQPEHPEQAPAADAEQQLLAEPVLAAAAVEPVGHLVQRRLVLLDVGVEHQQRHPADLGQPHLGGQELALGQRHLHLDRLAVRAAEQRQRQAIGVVGRVALGLPAVVRQRLGEVPVPVEQADPDDRHAEVAGRLQVVARQDAETARVLREHGGDAVLGGEVRDRVRQRACGARRVGLVPARLAGVLAQVGHRCVQAAQEVLVCGKIGEPARAH
jgi:hypothetical protein